jgi:hypothetical protein
MAMNKTTDNERYTHETIAIAFAITEVTFWFPDTVRTAPPARSRKSVVQHPAWADINPDNRQPWFRFARFGVWTY